MHSEHSVCADSVADSILCHTLVAGVVAVGADRLYPQQAGGALVELLDQVAALGAWHALAVLAPDDDWAGIASGGAVEGGDASGLHLLVAGPQRDLRRVWNNERGFETLEE